MHGQTGTPVSLNTFGGLVTLADSSSLPEGASPRTYDTDYLVGSVKSRAGLANVYSVVDAEIGPNNPGIAFSPTTACTPPALPRPTNPGENASWIEAGTFVPSQTLYTNPLFPPIIPFAFGNWTECGGTEHFIFGDALTPSGYTLTGLWSNFVAPPSMPSGATITAIYGAAVVTADSGAGSPYLKYSTDSGSSWLNFYVGSLGPSYTPNLGSNLSVVQLTQILQDTLRGGADFNISFIGLAVYWSGGTGGSIAVSGGWTNPNALVNDDGSYASIAGVGNPNSISLSQFAFNLSPSDSVTGITLTLEGYANSPANIEAQLLINGVQSGTVKTVALPVGTVGTITLGGPTDLWGTLPSSANVDSTSFGVIIAATSAGFPLATAFLRRAALTIAISTGTSNFDFLTTFTAQNGEVRNVYLDAGGHLWVEDVTNAPGLLDLATSGITANSLATGVEGPDVEYLTITDGYSGTDLPLQYTPKWIDRITQVGPGAAPTFTPVSATGTTYPIVNITQPAAQSQGFSYFLQSAGPGSNTPGNVITFYYLDATVAPGPDADLVAAVNSGHPCYAYVSFTGTPEPFGPEVVLITAVGEAQPPNQPRPFYYFTFTVPTVAYTFYPGSGHAGYTANYQRTLATLTTTVPVPGLTVGGQITVTGNSVSNWNSVWTVSQTPNSSTMAITGTSVAAGVASFNYSVTGGTAVPVAGELVTITNTLNAGGVLNVVQWPIASVSGGTTGTFTVSGFSGTLNASFVAEDGTAITAGTVFDFDPGQALVGTSTNPIYGTGTGGNLVFAPAGTFIDPGIYQGTVFFITRNGYFTAPAPPVTFTIPSDTSALQVANIPIGPPNVIARGIALTEAGTNGVPGANFFTLPTPVVFYVSGVKYTATSFYVNDNTSTTASLFFQQSVLLNALSIDSYGYNLFNQIELGNPGWVASYDFRNFYGLCQNKVQQFLNLSFDGGYLPSSRRFPLGWTAPDAYGELVTSPKFGNSYYIQNTTTGTLLVAGLIFQSAFQNYLKNPILQPNTLYSVRVTARIPSSLTAGTLNIALVSAGVNVGLYALPFSAMATVHEIYTGTLLTTALSPVPSDLTLNVYASNIGAGADVEIDRIEVFPTAIPIETTTVYGSYANLREQVDAVTGKVIASSENRQPVNGGVVMYDTLYLLKGSLIGASLYSLQSSKNLEPADWAEPEVAQRSGAIGPLAFDFGEQWILMANRTGIHLFEGGQPGKINHEIYQVWDAINWDAAARIWLKVDVKHRRILVGVPMPTPNYWLPNAPVNTNPTSPNVILMCNYQGLDSGEALKSSPQMHTTMFGTLNAIDMRRKWSIWQIPSPYANIMQTPTDTALYIGNGKGNSKVYRLDESAETDDGTIIDSLYTTAGLPEASKRAQTPGLGVYRMRWGYLVAQLQSLGNIATTLYPNVLLGPADTVPAAYDPWVVPGGFSPGDPAPNDAECPLNFAATRAFVEFRENDGHGFWLSNFVIRGAKDAWNALRGMK